MSENLISLLAQAAENQGISSHDAGFIYLIKAVGFHGWVPGFYLGRYKIGLSRDPNARVNRFYSSQFPCDIKIVTVIKVNDMAIAEAKLHKLFNKQRVRLKGGVQNSEWFELGLHQVLQARLAYYRMERHPRLGTVRDRFVPASILVLLGLISGIAIAALGTQQIPAQMHQYGGNPWELKNK